jgi:fumarate reductase subunit C
MLKRPVSPLDYFRKGPYFVFMLRELTSLFNALYLVFLLLLLHKLGAGREAYAAFLGLLWSPGMIGLHVVALGFSILHTVTWFNATGKAIVIRRGGERLPDAALAVPNYVAWALVSLFLFWIVLRG